MDIKNISGSNVIPEGSLKNSRKYVDAVTYDKQDKQQLEKIREEIDDSYKGKKIDTTA